MSLAKSLAQGRAIASALAVAAAAACAASEPAKPPPTEPAPPASTAPVDDANRMLTRAECESLAAWMLDACDERGNSRQAQLDQWCIDLSNGVGGDGAWYTKTCLPRIRAIDAACFRGTTSVVNLMDCERSLTH